MTDKKTLKSYYLDTLVRKESSNPKANKYRPSTLSSPCLRKIFYSHQNILVDFEADSKGKLIMELGNYIHLMLQDGFRKAGILIDYVKEDGTYAKSRYTGEEDKEFPLKYPKLGISAKMDALFKIDNELSIGEFKSCGYRKFKDLTAPDPIHQEQATIYFFLFNYLLKAGTWDYIEELKGFEKAEGIHFVYYEKGFSEWKEFYVKPDPKVFQRTISKISKINKFVEESKLPPKSDDYCNYCNWRKKCKKNLY